MADHFNVLDRGGGITHVDTGFVTSGDISATSGAFASLGDLTIAAVIGDVLVIEPDIVCTTGADTQFEAATRVSGADVSYWSSGTGTSRWPGGLGGWYVHSTTVANFAAPGRYTVAAGDISGGLVTARLYARSTGATRTIKADSVYPMRWALYNIGAAS